MDAIKQQQATPKSIGGIGNGNKVMPGDSKFTDEQRAERMDIALAATWEICALSRHLNSTLPDAGECLHVRAIAVRIRQLNSVVMSVLDNDARATQEIHDVVEGRRA